MPDILRLVLEVRRVGESRVLRWNGDDLVVVMPLPPVGMSRFKKPTEDYEAFRSSYSSRPLVSVGGTVVQIRSFPFHPPFDLRRLMVQG